MENYEIWIEAEQWAPGQWEPRDCNSDVMVTFETGARWMATSFTYQNIFSLAKKNKNTGECLNGKYFWASDMILIDEFTRKRVEQVVFDLLSVGDFEGAFRNADV